MTRRIRATAALAEPSRLPVNQAPRTTSCVVSVPLRRRATNRRHQQVAGRVAARVIYGANQHPEGTQ